MGHNISSDLMYLMIIFVLLVVPRALQRFNFPAPLGCLMIGILTALFLVTRDSQEAQIIHYLGIFGISTLFVFAGLEVNLESLRQDVWHLVTHLVLRGLALAAISWIAMQFGHYLVPGLDLPWQGYGLLSLALLTSSTGFIIDTLNRLGLQPKEKYWVVNKAIAAEFLALAALFVLMQSGKGVTEIALATTSIIGLIIALPLVFLAFNRWVVPYAPGSEFSLLIMVGLIAANISKGLGVYYLVGAFLTGIIAGLLQKKMPKLSSEENQHAVHLFAGFFVPFYFFSAGMKVPAEALSWDALGLGIGITLLILPLRIFEIWSQRRAMFFKSEVSLRSLRISYALTPTLVFTLVITAILKEEFNIPNQLFGALIVYATISTILPSFIFKNPPPELPVPQEEPEVEVEEVVENTAPADVEAKPSTPASA